MISYTGILAVAAGALLTAFGILLWALGQEFPWIFLGLIILIGLTFEVLGVYLILRTQRRNAEAQHAEHGADAFDSETDRSGTA